jgi:hypothetical protein
MVWDHISGRMIENAEMTSDHSSAMTYMMWHKNTFGMSVYSSKYAFAI